MTDRLPISAAYCGMYGKFHSFVIGGLAFWRRFSIATGSAAAALLAVALAANAQSLAVIDTHAHIDGRTRSGPDYVGAASVALRDMDRANIALALVLPPPQPPDFQNAWECDDYRSLPPRFPGRFALICGGGTISPLIVKHGRQPAVPADVKREITALVERFVKIGAVGLGEFAAEHFSFHSRHPYISVAADHPLFLHLADLAARHRLPIDLHMEAVAKKFVVPSGLRRRSPSNPATVAPNIGRLERLLAHNRGATIVWAHAGWDNTRQRSVALMRALLRRHPNLQMSLTILPRGPGSRSFITADGGVAPAFLELVEAFPDRFMIGIDAFFALRRTPSSAQTGERVDGTLMLLRKLSPPTARRVAFDNAVRFYRLRERGIVR